MKEKIKALQEKILDNMCLYATDIQKADTEEFSAVVDMLKDLAEFCYYKTITEAMEETKGRAKEQEPYYEEPRYYTPYMRYPNDRPVMYYGGNDGMSQNSTSSYARPGGRRMYEPYYEYEMMPEHSKRDGRSYQSRRGYMEAKEMHQDPATQMKELEKYMRDLSQDVTEMIMDATPAEKQTLKQKMTALIDKIN